MTFCGIVNFNECCHEVTSVYSLFPFFAKCIHICFPNFIFSLYDQSIFMYAYLHGVCTCMQCVHNSLYYLDSFKLSFNFNMHMATLTHVSSAGVSSLAVRTLHREDGTHQLLGNQSLLNFYMSFFHVHYYMIYR